MKKLTLLITVLLFGGNLFAQTYLSEQQYATMKQNGTLPPNAMVDPSNVAPPQTNVKPQPNAVQKSGCTCYQAPDASYTLCNFTSCDDGYLGPISLPFTFCLYGNSYNSFYINTNGNITFGSPYTTYTASGFPSNSFVMLAPFWGDVDLCGTGQVWYKVTPDAVFVNWEAVGYYPSATDKLNTFQCVFSDGNDAFIPGNDNVAFCYLDMQWTTGSASGGSGGFGGTPATVGVNAGNGIDFIQMGRFDQPGNAYDGPFNNNDGVDWLDNQSMSFDVCTSSGNVPPVSGGLGIPGGGSGSAAQFGNCPGGDTISICGDSDTLILNPVFYAPENGQTVTISANFGTFTNGTIISNNPGNPGSAIIMLIGDAANAGYHNITITGTDDGSPSASNSISFTLYVAPNTANINPNIVGDSIGCAGAQIMLALDSAYIYDNYLWNYSPQDSTITVDTTGEYYVTVEVNGCFKTATQYVQVFDDPVPAVMGNLFTCPNDSTLVSIDSSVSTNYPYDSLDWGMGLDTNTQVYLTPGTHALMVMDTNGCTGSISFTINSSAPLDLFDTPISVCNTLSTGFPPGSNTGEIGGVWTYTGPPGATATFNPANHIMPTITVDTYGVYDIVYTDPCGDSDSTTITFGESPNFTLMDTFFCAETFPPYTLDPGVNDPGSSYNYQWNTGDVTQTIVVADSGTYILTVTNSCGTDTDTSIVSTVVVDIPEDTSVCGTAFIIPSDSMNSPNGGYWTYTAPTANDSIYFIPGAGDDAPEMYSSSYGTYTLTYTDSLCGIQETMDILFKPFAYANIEDDTICRGSTIELDAELPNNDTYLWNTGATTPQITVMDGGLYYVTVSNECNTYTDSAYIVMIGCECNVPNVITPNGDGLNDFFYVDCLDFVKTSSLSIFNRWGNPVYEKENYDQSWNGLDNKGKKLSDGTYYYILYIADTDKYYKGVVNIFNNR